MVNDFKKKVSFFETLLIKGRVFSKKSQTEVEVFSWKINPIEFFDRILNEILFKKKGPSL